MDCCVCCLLRWLGLGRVWCLLGLLFWNGSGVKLSQLCVYFSNLVEVEIGFVFSMIPRRVVICVAIFLNFSRSPVHHLASEIVLCVLLGSVAAVCSLVLSLLLVLCLYGMLVCVACCVFLLAYFLYAE